MLTINIIRGEEITFCHSISFPSSSFYSSIMLVDSFVRSLIPSSTDFISTFASFTYVNDRQIPGIRVADEDRRPVL